MTSPPALPWAIDWRHPPDTAWRRSGITYESKSLAEAAARNSFAPTTEWQASEVGSVPRR